MAYPKKKAQSDLNNATKTPKMSEERRQRLLALQQREELKGMLVNKFIAKYGQKQKSHIHKEVDQFMKKHKMTEGNLEQLEKNIQAHHQEEGRLPSIDNQSVRSVRSNLSQKSKATV